MPDQQAEFTPTSLLPRQTLEAIAEAVAVAVARVTPVAHDLAPELITREQTANVLGISLSAFGDLEARGFVGPEPIRLGDGGRLVRYRVAEIRDWLARGGVPRAKWAVLKTASSRKAG